MEPTSFHTFSLPILGTGTAIQVVPVAPYFRRVAIVQSGGAPPVFIASVAEELDMSGVAVPGGGFQFPAVIGGDPLIFVVAPGERVVAAATVAGTRLAVSVSQTIPNPKGPLPPGLGRDPTTFRTYTLPAIGTQAVPITPGSSVPKRIVARVNAGTAFIGSDAGDQNIAGQPIPGNAFELIAVGAPSATFVTAPGQKLVASGDIVGRQLSLSVSDILISELRGPTGIPGPDGQE